MAAPNGGVATTGRRGRLTGQPRLRQGKGSAVAKNDNVTVMKRVYGAFSTGDSATLIELLSPDVVHRYPGTNPVSGEHKGRDAVLALYGRFAELTGGTLRVEPLEFQATGENTVSTVHRAAGNRPDGRQIDSTARLTVRIVDGQVMEIDEDVAEPDRVDAFWA
jgi:uncharacterized protein